MAFANTSHAATLANYNSAEFELNQASPNAMARNMLGTITHRSVMRTMVLTYDSATQSKVVGTVSLLNLQGKAASLPQKAIIRNCVIDVITTPTSGGSATIAIGTGQAANDLKAATAVASYTGLVACVPVGSAATSIRLTADRLPTMAIATADLTAGKFYVFVDYTVEP